MSARNVTARIVSCALVVPLLAVDPLRAGGVEPGLIDEIGALPSDLSLVVALERAGVARRSPAGRSAQGIVDGLLGADFLAELRASWGALSSRIGMDEGEAFDRLLGRRAIYVRGNAADARRDWALILTTDEKTEHRVRAGLKPAPRQPVRGRQILTIEDGRFLLGAMDGGRRGDRVRFVLAPAGGRALFLRLINGDADRPGLAGTDAVRRLRELNPDPSIVVLFRDGLRAVSLTGAVEGGSIEVSFLARVKGVERPDAPAPWPGAVFKRIAPGSALAIVEHESPAWRRFASGGAFFDASAEIIAPFTGHEFIGKKSVLVVDRGEDSARVTVAVETTDAEKLAPHADLFMSGFLDRLGYAGAQGGPGRIDFGGVHPRAIRTVGPNAEQGAADRVFGGRPDFAWCIRHGAPLEEGRAWWITGTDPRGVRSFAERLAEGADEDGARAERESWVLRARAEPAELVRMFRPVMAILKSSQPDAARMIESLSRVREAELRVLQSGETEFAGLGALRFGPEDGKEGP